MALICPFNTQLILKPFTGNIMLFASHQALRSESKQDGEELTTSASVTKMLLIYITRTAIISLQRFSCYKSLQTPRLTNATI